MRYESKRDWLIMEHPALMYEVGAEVIPVSPTEDNMYFTVFDGVDISKVGINPELNAIIREPKNQHEISMCLLSEARFMAAEATDEFSHGKWVKGSEYKAEVQAKIKSVLDEVSESAKHMSMENTTPLTCDELDEHDCDKCPAKGMCPVENIYRAMKQAKHSSRVD